MPYTKLPTWYKMVSANSVKCSSFSCNIFPSKTGEPSHSTFDAQSLLFWLPSRHDCGNTTISFVLLCVGTIWAAKNRTKVYYYAKTSRLPSNPSSDTYDLFWSFSSTSRDHVTWRHFWNESIIWIDCLMIALLSWPAAFPDRKALEIWNSSFGDTGSKSIES